MANGLRPLYWPWPRSTEPLGARPLALPASTLRGISGAATMTIEALVGFGSPILLRPGFFLCMLLGVRRGATYIRQTQV